MSKVSVIDKDETMTAVMDAVEDVLTGLEDKEQGPIGFILVLTYEDSQFIDSNMIGDFDSTGNRVQMFKAASENLKDAVVRLEVGGKRNDS